MERFPFESPVRSSRGTTYLKRVTRAKDREVYVGVPTKDASARTDGRTGLLLPPGSTHLRVPNDVSPVQSWIEVQGDVPGCLAQ